MELQMDRSPTQRDTRAYNFSVAGSCVGLSSRSQGYTSGAPRPWMTLLFPSSAPRQGNLKAFEVKSARDIDWDFIAYYRRHRR